MDLSRVPFRGKPLYYGWVIAVGIAFMNFTTIGLVTVNVGLFIDPMSRSLNISPSLLSWSQTAKLVGAAFSGLLLGKVFDVFNVKIPLMIVSLLVFLCFLCCL